LSIQAVIPDKLGKAKIELDERRRTPERHHKARLLRVLIAEDHTMIREGLKSNLRSYPNIDIVGEASNGEEALAKISELQPAVVVMDIVMPRLDGITATRKLKSQYPQIAVVGLSAHSKGDEVDAMIKAGAFEVITKDKAVHDLYEVIQRAAEAI
jgi:DNA-binding NarL/FixJ family response regulator